MKKFILPKSGEGPRPEYVTACMSSPHLRILNLHIYIFRDLNSGFFTVTNVATSAPTASSPRPVTVRTVFKGHGDPGYLLGAGEPTVPPFRQLHLISVVSPAIYFVSVK